MGGIKIAVWPDEARKEQIRRAIDSVAYIGCGMLLAILAFPYIDLDWLVSLPAAALIGVFIGVITPVAFFLFWLEEKIRVRKIWWSLGGLSWVACFALALSGYVFR